jgi:hypothetical protein
MSCAGHAQQPLQRFNADLAGTERPFLRRPDEISGEQPLCIEHQIAAMGAVQGACGQQVEIGETGPKACDMLDATNQGLIGRIVLVITAAPCWLLLSTMTLT